MQGFHQITSGSVLLRLFITDRFHNRQLPFKLEILKQRSSVIGLSVPNQKPDSCLPPLLNFTAILIIRFIKKRCHGLDVMAPVLEWRLARPVDLTRMIYYSGQDHMKQ